MTSCPLWVTTGSYQSGQMGQTVNLLSYDFGGSNPPLPTLSNRFLIRSHNQKTNHAGVAQLVEH
jgi:hypothetical protein